MLKSLFSGVSGLQSHQVAMDVESNNIANVNTIGFKYSRANFSDLLAQTNKIATAPQGELGGKNAVQVGLGTTISSMTRIHSQGSIQNSDKNTDVAIQGDGFFVISQDGGKTLKYTRSGDFKFDAAGNFVDNNGFVVQGWLRDEETGKVDSTAPITGIQIPPGLTTPALASSTLTLKANLNSGNSVENFSAISSLDMFPQAVDLQEEGQLGYGDLSLIDDSDNIGTVAGYNNNTGLYTVFDPDPLINDDDYYDENSPSGMFLGSNNKLIERGEDIGILVNSQGEGIGLQTGAAANEGQGIWIGFRPAQLTGGAYVVPAVDTPIVINGQTITVLSGSSAQQAVDAINQYTNATGVTASASAGTITIKNSNNGEIKNININAAAAGLLVTGGVVTDEPMKMFRYTDKSLNQVGWRDEAPASISALGADDTYYFKTSEDLRAGMQQLLRDSSPSTPMNGIVNTAPPQDIGGSTPDSNAYVLVSEDGKFEIYNQGINSPLSVPGTDDYSVSISIDAIVDQNTSENIRFTEIMSSLIGSVPVGNTNPRQSQGLNAPVHSSSIDIYDSLGSKHTVKLDFRKLETSTTTGARWRVIISVPEPAAINLAGGIPGQPLNMVEGEVVFTADGALSTFEPTTISFTGNNGSQPNQSIRLNLGTTNEFDGMTSFDSASATSGISQDGFTGGDLVGIRIDQSGTLVGSFSNGRSFGLAQVSMAKFANNEGLFADGGNIYLQSANSGEPIIGSAASGGRGFIQSSALEASNVDLSKSLTQLIIIQRGYQANGKTITTSDQLLETLIGLKR